MKKLLFTILFGFAVNFIFAQAHLGSTEYDIKYRREPNHTWTSGTNNYGTYYISTGMTLGVFAYYFNSNGLCDFCIQIPYNNEDLNTQIQIYNEKYVITSNHSWSAYVDGGSVIYIKLKYDNDNSTYIFSYSESDN